jgi:hypothetical protein
MPEVEMAALVFLAVILTLEPLIFVTNRLARRRRTRRRVRAAAASPVRAPTLDVESDLATELVAGRIDAPRYRDAMEAIACAEDLRSPLLVPGDGGGDVS